MTGFRALIIKISFVKNKLKHYLNGVKRGLKELIIHKIVLVKVIILLFLAFAESKIIAQNSDSVKTKQPFYIRFGKHFEDSTRKGDKLEISFGQNLLFISSSRQINIRQQAAIVIPTNAILFLVEFRPKKTLRIPIFLNIATESKQYIVGGQIINERASPTFGTGIIFRLIEFNLDKKSKIDFEIGPLASVLVDRNNNLRFAPVIASRFKICRGENFVMYFGVNYSIGINAFGIQYGTGSNF